ncbi:ATP-binding cassette, subfamily F, member 3 [Natronincola peptidivorans]|uniref:ATP-binding cassette, subfamily F, member 3 n=1 Tax=Natronincola peptidivorans TaxID=426128 RepID=A0A1I0AY18_9FIRM|nr:ABC-F family ATP-binding cassette domain-containing protein [Natronincola peptidivorans]SES99301.1 ATP-binding cassette, subfamily F, member 3 [Natronincola peptidivorans]
MSLLALENIMKEYRNQLVLNDVNLRIERGERLALVGPNGAGKTTLLKIAMGLEESDRGRVTIARGIKVGYLSQELEVVESTAKRSGEVLHYEKVYQLEKKLREMEKQMEEEGTKANAASHKILMAKYSKLLLRYEAMDGYIIETKIKKILLGLGLRQETLSTPLDKLSGGERMRVTVAKMLLEEPDLLILDEPTNHLDIDAIEWFEGFLKKFQGGILFVSHDRYFLNKVATRIAELEKGSICVRSGNYANYIEHKNQLSHFVLKEQKRLKWTIRNTHEKVQGFKSKGKVKASKSKEKEIEKLKRELAISLNERKKQEHLYKADGPKISFKKIKHLSKDIAWADNLRKSFGDVALFSGASFHIRGGERVGIIGPNGCGKSTLINMLLGKDKEYEGFLRLGEWVRYSYMGQEVLFQNGDMTILQLILSKKEMREKGAKEYLAGFQFYGDEVDKRIKVLSGGERVRLYLACMMLENADCLILDEPTNHLDMQARDAVEKALKEFKGTIITITHDRYYLTHCVSKILEIEGGGINTYEGNYDFYKETKYGSDEDGTEEKKAVTSKTLSKKASSKRHSSAEALSPQRTRQEIEEEIIILEDKMKAIETSLNKSTPSETYEEYNRLLKKVEDLYSKWHDLII